MVVPIARFRAQPRTNASGATRTSIVIVVTICSDLRHGLFGGGVADYPCKVFLGFAQVGVIAVTVSVLTIIIGVLGLSALLFIVRAIPGIRAYFMFRGKRLVTCPETKAPEAVNVAAGEAALGAFFREPTLRLHQCSRWPERQDCGQDCLQQIDIDPKSCLVWNIAAKWFEGKNCVFCRKSIGPLHHVDHAPALLGPDFQTTEWKNVRAEELPGIFATHRPVCWDCHIAESFRRLHPELVTDRPMEPRRTM